MKVRATLEKHFKDVQDVEFTIQSISKPFTYALALTDRGFDPVPVSATALARG